MEGTDFILTILFLFVLPITIIGIVTSYKKNMAELKLTLGNSDAKIMATELDAVKSRLEVLETIVTDSKYHLTAEIDALTTKHAWVRQ